MLISVLEWAIMLGGSFLLVRWALKAWHKAGIDNKIEEIEETERDYEVVNKTMRKYKKTGEKKNAVSKFKSN